LIFDQIKTITEKSLKERNYQYLDFLGSGQQGFVLKVLNSQQ